MSLIKKYYNIWVFISIFLLSAIVLTIDLTLSDGNKCLKQIKTLDKKIMYCMILLLHNIGTNNMYLGWLYNDIRIIYALLVFVALMFLHWPVCGNRCMLTVDAEKICKNENSNLFNDITKMIGFKKKKNIYLLVIFSFIIAGLYVYKIYKINY